jgi:phosphoribosylaminoimidazole-succinocarboxamide synthase
MQIEPVLTVELNGFPLFRRGKVREVFEAGEHLLFVATDRLSAFDVVMPNGIPRKGEVLTAMSRFWFDLTRDLIGHHFLTADLAEMERLVGRAIPRPDLLEGRSMLVRRTKPYPLECVVRGYLAGSGWKEYKERGTLAGITLPGGLRESDRLPEPLFTPSTKADTGHDENLTQDEARALVGEDAYDLLSRASLAVYNKAAAYAETKGIIIADTKFEFGALGNSTLLIDEVLTPDSSRFWPLDGYHPGGPQPSFDKQFVRDWLEASGWDKKPPAPALPEDVVRRTSEKYLEAKRLLTEQA